MSATPFATRQARALMIAAGLAVVGSEAGAQQSSARWQPEAHAAALVANSVGAHASVGASMPVGIYVRVGGALGADLLRERGGARADIVARFLLDPFMQYARAPYGGAGLSVRDEHGRARAYLVVLLGAEGPVRHGVLPSAELSLGGGLRMGLVLRRAIPGRR